MIEHLHEFAELGCQTAIVGVGNVHDVARVRALAEKVYPAVARF